VRKPASFDRSPRKGTRLTKTLSIAAAIFCLNAAHAQDSFPSKPITIIVPFAAGGTMDKLARELAEPLRRHFGQPVLISNQPGAGGNVGLAAAMKAAPDGHTWVMAHNNMATSPALYRTLAFKPETDFEPLGVVVDVPLVLVARPQNPCKNAAELISWMAGQKNPTIANAGAGSGSHLCGLLLQSALKISITTVPYRGNAPALTDLLGGHVDLMCDLTANALPYIQAGQVRALAVTTTEPLTGTPLADVPTTARFGMPEVELSIWFSLYAPKGTPTAVQKKINEAVALAVKNDVFVRAQTIAGVQIVKDARRTPEGHRAFLAKESARWIPLIKAAGTYAE